MACFQLWPTCQLLSSVVESTEHARQFRFSGSSLFEIMWRRGSQSSTWEPTHSNSVQRA